MPTRTFDRMSAEEHKEISAKGGRNKRKKTIKEDMLKLLNKSTNQKALCQGLIESASKGNAKSAELILKIIGENPDKQDNLEDYDNPFTD